MTLAGVGGVASKFLARPSPFWGVILVVLTAGAAAAEAGLGASSYIAEGDRAIANAAATAALVSASLFSLGMIYGSW